MRRRCGFLFGWRAGLAALCSMGLVAAPRLQRVPLPDLLAHAAAYLDVF
jgi:hypothetical protein